MQSRIKFQKAHGNARHPLLRFAVKLEVTTAVNFTIRNIHYETFCHLLKSINSETVKTVTVAKLGNHVHVTRIPRDLLTALPRPCALSYSDNADSAGTCRMMQAHAIAYNADRFFNKT